LEWAADPTCYHLFVLEERAPLTFIAYAREDSEFALRLADDLAAAGWSIWIDQRNLAPGDRWDEVVQKTLARARVVLIVFSPEALESEAVLDEMSYALNSGKTVVPVLHRICDLPLRVTRLHYIDFTRSYERGFQSLAGTQFPHSSATTALGRQSSYIGIYLVVVVLLALIVTVLWIIWLGKRSSANDHGAVSSPTSSSTTQVTTSTEAGEQPNDEQKDKLTTPDYSPRQGYLGQMHVAAAWANGGTGEGITVALVGQTKSVSHEDLPKITLGLGSPSTEPAWTNQFIALAGIVCARKNDFGVTGVAPRVRLIASSSNNPTSSSGAIVEAVKNLQPGDVLLIGLERQLPSGHDMVPTERGPSEWGPLEWAPDDFAAIRYATGHGIIVVSPAGDAGISLEREYKVRPAGFPSSWSNPCRRGDHDSGSIIVGAGAPPPGTHGRDHGPDRSRLPFSNFGSCVDVQAWGCEVTTTGYGDLLGGTDERRRYTDRFSTTTASAAIVAGVVASVQSALLHRGVQRLTPAEMRMLLRNTGTPQANAPARPNTQRIGPRPDLQELINAALTLRNRS